MLLLALALLLFVAGVAERWALGAGLGVVLYLGTVAAMRRGEGW